MANQTETTEIVFTPIYKGGGPNDTIADMINAFASCYFDTPRKAIDIQVGDEPLTATFKLVNGYRLYKIAPTVGNDTRAYLISVSGLKNNG